MRMEQKRKTRFGGNKFLIYFYIKIEFPLKYDTLMYIN